MTPQAIKSFLGDRAEWVGDRRIGILARLPHQNEIEAALVDGIEVKDGEGSLPVEAIDPDLLSTWIDTYIEENYADLPEGYEPNNFTKGYNELVDGLPTDFRLSPTGLLMRRTARSVWQLAEIDVCERISRFKAIRAKDPAATALLTELLVYLDETKVKDPKPTEIEVQK